MNKWSSRLVATSMLLLLIASACTPEEQDSPTADSNVSAADLEGSAWKMVSLSVGEGAREPAGTIEVTAQFDGLTMSGVTGCNQYWVDYTLEGDSLTSGSPTYTEMGCEPDRMAMEARFLEALGRDNTFRLHIQGSQLTMESAASSLVFEAIESE